MSSRAFTNRLAAETSPYLLQHAHNPVDWYPWGPEAFEIARREDKPIFLSVGYSTCYWCHVMERQSFESEAIAAEMNRLFVNIKVDREERPDVDQLYMTAVQVLTRQGGWPMSVFLTPQLEPFYGGTYFPPTDGYGRPGFLTLIRAIEEAYRQRRGDINRSIDQLTAVLRQLAVPGRPRQAMTMDGEWVEALLERSLGDYDPAHGGFGRAPKFPRQTLLELILVHHKLHPNAGRMRKLARTLDAMADGGIHDQLGGGFHRYSTDAQWLVPHFEIMLYDNALLGWIYTEASAQLAEPRYARIAQGIFDFILREMTAPSGAFYTAFDAEVDAREGENYLWTGDEIEQVLRAASIPENGIALFRKAYGVDLGPNFSDPHHGHDAPEKNILFLPVPLYELAEKTGTTPEALEERLEPMRQALLAARQLRKQPLLDTKILTSWNALMIRALAHAGMTLHEPRYLDAAERAARFLLDHHRDAGSLKRTSRADSPVKYDAFLDDYAFLADAMLALEAARPGQGWRSQAARLAEQMSRQFRAEGSAFFYTTESAEDLIVRQMVGADSPLPSGNGIAAQVMLALGNYQAAKEIVTAFSTSLEDQAEGMSALLQAVTLYVHQHGPIEVQLDELQRSNAARAADVVTIHPEWVSPNELLLELNIEKGFHLNANTASLGLIPTTAVAEEATITYPPATTMKYEFAEETLEVYEGKVILAVTFKQRVTQKTRVTLNYQPCNDTSCLAAITRMIEVKPPKVIGSDAGD